MQDEYVNAIKKVGLGNERKKEMREYLISQMTAPETKAVKTRLNSGMKTGLIAAAALVAITGTLCIPVTRNAISAAVKSIFSKPVPEDSTDQLTKEQQDRSQRVIPEDIPSAEENYAAVMRDDQLLDAYYDRVKVDPSYYSDPELNELATFYASQGCTLLDLKKDSEEVDMNICGYDTDWFKEGFSVAYWEGDNATGSLGNILVFKADDAQLQNFLDDEYEKACRDMRRDGQEIVSFEDFWTVTEGDDGCIIYKADWVGAEPEIKIFESDSACYENREVTYDPSCELVIFTSTQGGGVG